MPRLLFIEDDENLSFMISESLESQGFEVFSFESAEEALLEFNNINPSIVLTDVNLYGEMDGFDFSKHIRKQCNIPILFITSRTHAEDLKRGFEIGNVDYLKKPFGISELSLRIKELLLRSSIKTDLNSIEIGRYTFDVPRKNLNIDGEIIHLNPTETKLLTILSQRRNEPLSKQDIALHFTFGAGQAEAKKELNDGTFYNAIASLREKLSKDKQISLESNPQTGYMLRV